MAVRVEKSGAITTVVLSRPEVRNAVDRETADALVAAFTAFDADPTASVGGARDRPREPGRPEGREPRRRRGARARDRRVPAALHEVRSAVGLRASGPRARASSQERGADRTSRPRGGDARGREAIRGGNG